MNYNQKVLKQHFQNLPTWPETGVFDKTVDGLVPSAQISSWEEFNEVVKHYRADEGGEEYIFRGHPHYKWFLEPTLDRMTAKAIDYELAQKHLRNFRLAIRGRVVDNALLGNSEFDDDRLELELWAIGQHHGLATPLLDWTRSPYVALFFAFMDEDHEDWKDKEENPTNYSRAVYILNKSFIEDLEDPVDNKFPRIVEPSKDDHGRLVNQAGLFTIAPYGETLESSLLKALADSRVDIDDPAEVAKYLCKVHIPNSEEARRDCLRQLRKMNIHHASLFPDIIGASGYCNELAREYVAKRSRAKGIDKEEVEPTLEYWATHTLPSDAKGLKPLIDALLVNDTVKQSVTPEELAAVARGMVEFINTKAGVDWYVRDSELARLRTVVRRSLAKTEFDDSAISEAATAAVDAAAAISLEANRPKPAESVGSTRDEVATKKVAKKEATKGDT